MTPAIARILDANFNRAREALRVMEDYARFVTNDSAGCEVVKRLRHDLAACVRCLPSELLLAGRDTPGDVGTAISTESERRRADAAEVFVAAAKRLPEALRTIEEYAKTVDPRVSAQVEALRYRAYDLEQRLALRGDRAGRFARTRLYVLITESLISDTSRAACAFPPSRKEASRVSPPLNKADPCVSPPLNKGGPCDSPPLNKGGQGGVLEERASPSPATPPHPPLVRGGTGEATLSSTGGPAWLRVAEDAIAGGADCIQLREKSLDDGERLARARQLAALCRRHGVLFIVNDRPDLAVLADADGVHLGQTDMPLRDARRIVGPDRLIGLSTHTPEQLDVAIAAAPDYIAVGPMFDTTTKPQDHIAGPELLARATHATQIPIVPIGGITTANAGILVASGAQRLCVCAAVIGAADPHQAVSQLMACLGSGESVRR